MHRRLAIGLLLATVPAARAAWDPQTGTITNERWESGVPLGGVGCGAVRLTTDGGFTGLTTQHNWTRPTGDLRGAFLAIACDGVGRLLRRPGADEYTNVAGIATLRANVQFPRVLWRCEDPALPVTAAVRAFSPLVAGDVRHSCLPAIVFEVELVNRDTAAHEVSVAFAWPNPIGYGERAEPAAGRGVQPGERGLRYIAGESPLEGDPRANALGEYYLVADDPDPTAVVGWDDTEAELSWWDAFVSGEPPSPGRGPAGALIVTRRLAAGDSATVAFSLSWRFPHHCVRRTEVSVSDDVTVVSAGVDAAVDGDPATRWTTGRPMLPGDALILRPTEPATADELYLDYAGSPNDGPRGLRIDAQGGNDWRTVRTLSPREVAREARDGRLRVRLAAGPITAIRLVQLGQSDDWWWSVHEATLRDPDGRPIPLLAFAELRRAETRSVTEDLGSYPATLWSDARTTAEYTLAYRSELARATARWQSEILDSTLPAWLKRKLLGDAHVLFANSLFTADGRLALLPDDGAALGSLAARAAVEDLLAALMPDLHDAELALFAASQGYDGPLPNEHGELKTGLALGALAARTTDPKPTCRWLLATARQVAADGDGTILATRFDAVRRAADWLLTRPPAEDPATVLLTVAALRAAGWLALRAGRPAVAKPWWEALRAARERLTGACWNGRYLGASATGLLHAHGLEGEALRLSAGLDPLLDGVVVRSSVKHLLAGVVRPGALVPPAAVRPDGNIAEPGAELLPLQATLAAPAIRLGYVGDGLALLERLYDLSWEVDRSPWDQPLWYDAHTGERHGHACVSAAASWSVLPALAGLALDLPGETLHLAPVLPAGAERLRVPVYTPTFAATLEYRPDADQLTLTVNRTYGPWPGRIREVRGAPGATPVRLAEPWVIRPGAVLELGAVHRQLQPEPNSRDVGFTIWARPDRRRGYDSRGWRARALGEGLPRSSRAAVGLAFDGDLATRWSTDREMQAGDGFEVDLGATRAVSRIELDTTLSRRDFPRGLEVLVSSDGRGWTRLGGVSVLTGDDGSVRVTFAPVAARRIRLVNQGSARGLWWSIHELYIYP